MKKIKKTFVSIVLTLISFVSLVRVLPEHNVSYASSESQEIIAGDVIYVASGLKTTGVVGETFYVPSATTKTIDGIVVEDTVFAEVTSPDGETIQLSDNHFIPTMIGNYKIRYQATNPNTNITTISETFNIYVSENEDYFINIKKNEEIILPITVDTNSERFSDGDIKKIQIPNPIITDNRGFVIYKDGELNGAISYYDSYITKDYDSEMSTVEKSWFDEVSKYNIKTDEIELYKTFLLKVAVKTQTKTYSSIPNTEEVSLLKDSQTKLYYFTPEDGENDIDYSLIKDGVTISCLTKTVLGSDTYDHTKIKLGFSAADRPTTASLNDEVRLPYAKGYNKSDANSAVNVQTIFTVNLVEGSTKTPVEVKYDENGAYFIPTVKEGDYEITYNVKDYYGNTATAYSYRIENVVDSKAPTMYIINAFDYTTTADAIVAMQNAEYMIPTKVGRGKGEIVFPAMFAQDSFVPYENLTFYRTITSTKLTTSVNLLDNTRLKAIESEDVSTITSNAQKAAHEAYINLGEVKNGVKKYPAGEYTVTYTVRDGSGYSASKSFNFTIEEEFEDTTAPVVTYDNNLPRLVENGQEVSFAVPTISDNIDLKPRIKYFVTAGLYKKQVFSKDGFITFNISDTIDTNTTIYEAAIANDNKVLFTTEVVDDYNNETVEDLEFVIKNNDTKLIEIRGLIASDFATGQLPSWSTNFRQNSEVLIPGIAFIDNDPNLTITATVRDANGNKVTEVKALGAIEAKISGADIVYAHPGVKYTPTKAESYTVTYTAIDAGSNIVAYTVKLPTMADGEKPIITGVTSGKLYEIELGQKLDLGRVTVVDNVDSGLVPAISCDAHPEYVNGTIFAPTEVGTYTVKYTAKDNSGNEADPVLVEVKVKDTTKPTLIINNKESYPTTMKEQTNVTNNSDFVAIELPSFSAEDETYDFGSDAAALNMSVTAKLEIVAPNGNIYTIDNANEKYKISYVEANDCYSFVPTTKGTYTAKYTAVDASGNEAESYTISIMVGDTVPPTVDYVGNLPAEIDISYGKLIFDTSKIVVTDNSMPEDGETYEYNTISLINNNSGDLVEYEASGEDGTIRTYTFESAGTYTLTIVVKDDAGNTGTYSREIVVLADITPPVVGYAGEITTTFNLGECLYIDESLITVTDEGFVFDPNYPNKKPDWVKISVMDSFNNLIEYSYVNSGVRKYVFEIEGQYELAIVGKDVSGNENAYIVIITVNPVCEITITDVDNDDVYVLDLDKNEVCSIHKIEELLNIEQNNKHFIIYEDNELTNIWNYTPTSKLNLYGAWQDAYHIFDSYTVVGNVIYESCNCSKTKDYIALLVGEEIVYDGNYKKVEIINALNLPENMFSIEYYKKHNNTWIKLEMTYPKDVGTYKVVLFFNGLEIEEEFKVVKDNTGLIIAIIVPPALVLIAAVIFGILYYLKKRKKS